MTFFTSVEFYYTRDAARGVPLTFTWFVEEVGELAKEIAISSFGLVGERNFARHVAYLEGLTVIPSTYIGFLGTQHLLGAIVVPLFDLCKHGEMTIRSIISRRSPV